MGAGAGGGDVVAVQGQRTARRPMDERRWAEVRLVKELLGCSCLESAAEWWAGKYQFRFQMNKAERFRNCPVEISVGSILIPHGFEYYGENWSFHFL